MNKKTAVLTKVIRICSRFQYFERQEILFVFSINPKSSFLNQRVDL